MYFNDRIDAAQRLADALAGYRASHPLILAIPRGAVPMGGVIAEALDADLDVVLVHKLHSPWNAEFAIGAIDESGVIYLSREAADFGGDDAYLKQQAAEQLESLRRRRALFSRGHAAVDPKGRVVIVVDDGLATGATMIAALKSVRRQNPAKLICAVPVAAQDSLEAIEPYADEVVCLAAPPDFHAVGQFYRDFPQVEDEEAVACLAQRSMPASSGERT